VALTRSNYILCVEARNWVRKTIVRWKPNTRNGNSYSKETSLFGMTPWSSTWNIKSKKNMVFCIFDMLLSMQRRSEIYEKEKFKKGRWTWIVELQLMKSTKGWGSGRVGIRPNWQFTSRQSLNQGYNTLKTYRDLNWMQCSDREQRKVETKQGGDE
jgi:hypothetical protein